MPQQIFQKTIVAKNLKEALKEVPLKIRDWFSSEKITDLIINLNTKLGLESKIGTGLKFEPASEKATVIPLLILRLQIKDLEPQNFTQELSSQLNVDYEVAKSIAREIKKQILEPISQTLLRWEVDINRIAVGGLSFSEIKPPTKPEIEKKIEPKPLPVEPPTEAELNPAPFPTSPTIPTTPSLVAPTIPPPADKPFIIHQETEPKPVGERKRGTPPIIGWFQKEKPKRTEPAIKVELETPGPKIEEKKEPIVAKTEAPKQKVIHYREVEMPTPFGKPGIQPSKETQPPKPEESKVINLDTFRVVKEKDKGLG